MAIKKGDLVQVNRNIDNTLYLLKLYKEQILEQEIMPNNVQTVLSQLKFIYTDGAEKLNILKKYKIENKYICKDTVPEDEINFNLDNHLLKMQLEDIFIHKELMLKTSRIMFNYLYLKSKHTTAYELIFRAYIHDQSKFNTDEFFLMAQFSDDAMWMAKVNSYKRSDLKMFPIKLHRSRNPHHPEFWKSLYKMKEIDKIEMCCDWYSRSVQFNTPFLEWVNYNQENRFKFPDDFFKDIFRICELIASLV